VAVSFDLFGTLVTAPRPDDPWVAVADALAERDVRVPDDWETAYRTSHADVDPLAEQSLAAHTRDALASRGVAADENTVREAVLAAFDRPVTVVDGAADAVAAATRRGPVGVLSNCSVPGLVERTLARAGLAGEFDAVVASVDCGWRKPHDRAFTCVSNALGVEPTALLHVGDDPRADGGGQTLGVRVVLTGDRPLTELPALLEAER